MMYQRTKRHEGYRTGTVIYLYCATRRIVVVLRTNQAGHYYWARANLTLRRVPTSSNSGSLSLKRAATVRHHPHLTNPRRVPLLLPAYCIHRAISVDYTLDFLQISQYGTNTSGFHRGRRHCFRSNTPLIRPGVFFAVVISPDPRIQHSHLLLSVTPLHTSPIWC